MRSRFLPLSIRTRLALGVALQTTVALLLVAAVQFVALRSFLDLAEHERLETLLPGLQTTIGEGLRRPGATLPLEVTALPGGVDVRVLRGNEVLAQSDNFPSIPQDTASGYRPLAGHSVLTAPLTVAGTPVRAQLASDVLGVINPLRAYLRALSLTVPLAAAVVALLSFLLAGRLLRPITQLRHAATQLGRERNLRAPLPGTGGRDELGRLASALQASFRQLAEVQEREEAFTRAAAHDLRSPLAALKIRLQGALGRPGTVTELRSEMEEVLSDVERMRLLTEHLLLLASGQQDVQGEPLDLADITGEAVDRMREQDPETLLEFWTEGDTTISGDRRLISALIENLIGNALRHAPETDVKVRVGATGAEVYLCVSDAGPGVPDAVIPHLTEAFYQVNTVRSGPGNGLGLAIVQRIVLAHAGSLQISNGQPHGLNVEVTFPQFSSMANIRHKPN
ncbi:HAMP domain-containing sensor histidine kinase [Deinococcus sp. UYEF24]